MQLKPERNIRGALFAATCTLLGQSSAVLADAGDWTYDSAILYYSETDRVTAIEPVFSARRELVDDGLLDLKLVFDSLTGASASGAMPSSQPQTFTRPSGRGSYTVDPGSTPLDDTFHDKRGAFSAAWSSWLDRDWKMTLGGNISSEYDFQSLSANLLFARDFNMRNTTLSFGLSHEADSLDPVGGVPTPLMRMLTEGRTGTVESTPTTPGVDTDDADYRDSTESKSVTDFMLGLTQVLDRETLLQLNYSYSMADGYLTDPYKLVSVIDTTAGAGYGDPLHHIYENRPDTRKRHILYTGIKHWLDGDVLNASYRYTTDDWGITSHTLDFRYRLDMGGPHHLEPHLRYYRQSAADFYRRGLLDSEALPEYVSADYRVGELVGTTIGAQYGYQLNDDSEFRVRLEYYRQSGGQDESVNIGTQLDHELFPEVDATIVQFSYSFRF